MPISLCCLLQTSIWVDFFHSGLPVTCPVPQWILTAPLPCVYCNYHNYLHWIFVWLQQFVLLSAAEYPRGSPYLNKLFFPILCSTIYIKRGFFQNCNEDFFIKIHFLYYFKILLYEEHCQKYAICILPIIFLSLVLLTQLCNFLSYWTESTLFIVTHVRSQVQIFFLDHLIFFSVLQEYFCHRYIQWNHLTFA